MAWVYEYDYSDSVQDVESTLDELCSLIVEEKPEFAYFSLNSTIAISNEFI